MTRRADFLTVGVSLGTAGGAILIYALVRDDATLPHLLGALLLIATGIAFAGLGLASVDRSSFPVERLPRLRHRRAFGLVLILGGLEVALWSIGTADRAGELGIASGCLLVGILFVVLGARGLPGAGSYERRTPSGRGGSG
jgi:hypothetical protein